MGSQMLRGQVYLGIACCLSVGGTLVALCTLCCVTGVCSAASVQSLSPPVPQLLAVSICLSAQLPPVSPPGLCAGSGATSNQDSHRSRASSHQHAGSGTEISQPLCNELATPTCMLLQLPSLLRGALNMVFSLVPEQPLK